MRRLLPATALVALLAVPAPAPAQGPSADFSLRQAGEAVVDKPIQMVAQGVTNQVGPDRITPSYNIEVRAKDGDISPVCGVTDNVDDGVYLFRQDLGIGAFTLPFPVTAVPPPGRLLICAYMLSYNNHVAGPVAFYANVRAPRHKLKVVVPRRVRPGRRASVRFSGEAEVARLLLARIARGKTRCGESDAATGSTTRLTGVQGVPPGPLALTARTRTLRRGTYTVCAYIQKTVTDAKADKVARKVIRVR